MIKYIEKIWSQIRNFNLTKFHDGFSIKNRFLFIVVTIVVGFVISYGLFFYQLNRISHYHQIQEISNKIKSDFLLLHNHYSEKLLGYVDDSTFFLPDITVEDTVEKQLITDFNNEIKKVLDNYSDFAKDHMKTLNSISSNFMSYSLTCNEILIRLRQKGYNSYGLSGELYETLKILNQIAKDDKSKEYVKTISKFQQEYLQYKNHAIPSTFLETYKTFAEIIKVESGNNIISSDTLTSDSLLVDSIQTNLFSSKTYNDFFISVLNQNRKLFTDIVQLDKEMGVHATDGLRGDFLYKYYQILASLQSFNDKAYQHNYYYLSVSPYVIFGVTILLLIILSWNIIIFSKIIILEPIKLLDTYLIDIKQGILPKKKLRFSRDDELVNMTKSINTIVDGLKRATEFAKQVGNNKFDNEFTPMSQEDELGNSLLDMRSNLQKAKIEEEKRKEVDEILDWTTEGIAKFNDILRQNNDNLFELSYAIISNMVAYLGANQGGLFILNDENTEDIHLEMLSAYAYERRKFLEKKILLGEGFVGTCVLEKETILLKNLPDDYIEITSGLGSANPKNLVVVPLKKNDMVMGVIEIASFKDFEKHEIEFLEKLAETIAVTLATSRNNQKTNQLLEKSKIQAVAMAEQEEQMKINLKDLQDAQMSSQHKEMEMKGMIEAIDNTIMRAEYNIDGNFITANFLYLNVFEFTLDEIKLLNIRVFVPQEDKESFEMAWDRVLHGKSYESTVSRINRHGNLVWIVGSYTPIFDNDGNISKIILLATNITEQKKKELKTQNEIQELKQKLSVEATKDKE